MKKHEYLDGLIASIQNESCSVTNNKDSLVKSLKDKNLVVYFYPRDNTPGCTLESNGFAKYYSEFQDCDTEVIGVSRDSIASHDKFKSKQELPFELISDTDEVICKIFDVLSNGKLVRSTFLFGKKGELIKEWRKVKVLGHVKEVFSEIKK